MCQVPPTATGWIFTIFQVEMTISLYQSFMLTYSGRNIINLEAEKQNYHKQVFITKLKENLTLHKGQEGRQVKPLLTIKWVISGKIEKIKTDHSNHSDNDLCPVGKKVESMIQIDKLLFPLTQSPLSGYIQVWGQPE